MARPAIPEASRRRVDDTVERLRALLPDDWNVTVAHRQPDRGIISIADDDGNCEKAPIGSSSPSQQAASRIMLLSRSARQALIR